MLDALLDALRQIFPITGFTALGVLSFIFGSILLRASGIGIGYFTTMFQPTVIVHAVVPSAIDRVLGGMVGCLLGVPAFFFGWSFLISGTLLIVFQEDFVTFLLELGTQVFGIEI